MDEEVGTFLNVFSLRPDKLARSCEITAHVKFIKTQIPNISSFFFFFFLSVETLYAGPIYSDISRTCKLYDQLIIKYHALFDRYLPYDKMVVRTIRKQLAPKNSRRAGKCLGRFILTGAAYYKRREREC